MNSGLAEVQLQTTRRDVSRSDYSGESTSHSHHITGAVTNDAVLDVFYVLPQNIIIEFAAV